MIQNKREKIRGEFEEQVVVVVVVVASGPLPVCYCI